MKRFVKTCLTAVLLSTGSAGAQEIGRDWTLYGDSLKSSNPDSRDIDIQALTLSNARKQLGPLTFGIQGGFLSASGRSRERNESSYVSADSFAVFAGGFSRLSPPKTTSITPFLEFGIAAMITDRPFPDHPDLSLFDGRVYGKFDARLGVDVALTDALQIEAALALNHISNGTGLGPQNINFDGAGFSIGIVQSW